VEGKFRVVEEGGENFKADSNESGSRRATMTWISRDDSISWMESTSAEQPGTQAETILNYEQT
jgi:hypothetical protein